MLDESSDVVLARASSSKEAEYQSANGEEAYNRDDGNGYFYAQGHSFVIFGVILIAA